MTATGHYLALKKSIPEHVKLVAVSKTKPPPEILEVYVCGQRLFGENKVQELLSKKDYLPNDICWHMIGHLQSNKVKYIAPFIAMIHAVDSLKLLKTIDKEARKNDRVIPCLLQIYIAEEETKFGMSEEELFSLLNDHSLADLNNIQIAGLMGMASFTDDADKISKEFTYLKNLFDRVREMHFSGDPGFCELSMGMSDDFMLGIEHGSTMVRIGSAIFGEREKR